CQTVGRGQIQRAGTPAAPTTNPPQSPNMTFFVTSVGLGKGADLGGIESADRYCQQMASTAGAGNKTWRAYLSTQAADGKPAVNTRDRIANGPSQNLNREAVATIME